MLASRLFADGSLWHLLHMDAAPSLNPALVAEEREDLQYRTADTTAKTYSRVFEVTRVH